jgi:hypothetical protein
LTCGRVQAPACRRRRRLVRREKAEWFIEEVRGDDPTREYLHSQRSLHDVITFDTRSVLQSHEAGVYLSPINSGSTLFNPAKRGRSTFRPLALYEVLEKRPPIELLIEAAAFSMLESTSSTWKPGTGTTHFPKMCRAQLDLAP